jgi:hypothetical protein
MIPRALRSWGGVWIVILTHRRSLWGSIPPTRGAIPAPLRGWRSVAISQGRAAWRGIKSAWRRVEPTGRRIKASWRGVEK